MLSFFRFSNYRSTLSHSALVVIFWKIEESEGHDEVQVLHVVPAVVNLDDSGEEDNVGPDGSLRPTASSGIFFFLILPLVGASFF